MGARNRASAGSKSRADRVLSSLQCAGLRVAELRRKSESQVDLTSCHSGNCGWPWWACSCGSRPALRAPVGAGAGGKHKVTLTCPPAQGRLEETSLTQIKCCCASSEAPTHTCSLLPRPAQEPCCLGGRREEQERGVRRGPPGLRQVGGRPCPANPRPPQLTGPEEEAACGWRSGVEDAPLRASAAREPGLLGSCSEKCP